MIVVAILSTSPIDVHEALQVVAALHQVVVRVGHHQLSAFELEKIDLALDPEIEGVAERARLLEHAAEDHPRAHFIRLRRER